MRPRPFRHPIGKREFSQISMPELGSALEVESAAAMENPMADLNKPGSGVIPSALAERRRNWAEAVSGTTIYALALAVLSLAIIVIVLVTS